MALDTISLQPAEVLATALVSRVALSPELEVSAFGRGPSLQASSRVSAMCCTGVPSRAMVRSPPRACADNNIKVAILRCRANVYM